MILDAKKDNAVNDRVNLTEDAVNVTYVPSINLTEDAVNITYVPSINLTEDAVNVTDQQACSLIWQHLMQPYPLNISGERSQILTICEGWPLLRYSCYRARRG